jgi:2,4-dienoyl-CoA reductase-like NADH-dependent reductase (Old Yellow Enzyme family)/alpha-beta hydrolase superfamily lysophospholipase
VITAWWLQSNEIRAYFCAMPGLLFSPASLGTVRLANRLVRSATLECLCPDPGVITDRYVRLYENLARGGAGLIITGNYFVHRLGIVQENNLLVDTDDVIPELLKVTAAVKAHDVPIFAQVNHGGRYARPPLTGAEPLAPSAVRDTINRVVPRVMTEEEIETAIVSFVSAAGRVREAGFDGIEINATHGYLVNQFLSRFTNRRQDRWGGSGENRFRFLGEIVRRIRAHEGSGFPVTVKLSGSDFMPHGITVEECVGFAQELESLGACGLTISGGFKEKAFRTMSRGDIPQQLVLGHRKGVERMLGRVLLASMQRSSRFREGYFLPHAAAVKRRVSIPVTAVGGFRTLAVMEQALEEGRADLIGLSRPLVREPHLPRKLREGRSTSSTCVNCNRCTVMTSLLSESLRCHWKKEWESDGQAGMGPGSDERLVTSDGFSLFYRAVFPSRPRANILFLHGMSEHSGMYLHVIRAWADAGYAVIAPDQRGRGRSVDGRWRRGDLHSVGRVLADLDELLARHEAELDGHPLFVVGVSMGSIIAQMYALRRQDSLSGIVLVGPPSGARAGTSGPLLALSAPIAAAAPRLAVRPAPPIPHISRVRDVQNELDWDPWCYHGPLRMRAGRQLAGALTELGRRTGELRLPLLILYGTEDRIVSPREVQEIHDRWGGEDRSLRTMNGLYHDVLNEPERQDAIDAILAWLSRHL